MKKVNLRELYPDVYKTDHFVEVTEDVLETIRSAERAEAAYDLSLIHISTGNLDSMTSSDVLSLLKVTSTKFHQTLVMITHNNEIAQLADRIIRIEDGKIVQ